MLIIVFTLDSIIINININIIIIIIIMCPTLPLRVICRCWFHIVPYYWILYRSCTLTKGEHAWRTTPDTKLAGKYNPREPLY